MHPDREPDALDQATELAGARRDERGARSTLRALIAREPGNARARAAARGLLEKKGDLEGALAELGRALEYAPDDVSILCARAPRCSVMRSATIRRKSTCGAPCASIRAMRTCRSNSAFSSPSARGGARRSSRCWPLSPPIRRSADAHYHLGDAYNHIDELPAALAAYEASSTLQPRRQRALKGIGIVLDRLGRPAEAAAATAVRARRSAVSA